MLGSYHFDLKTSETRTEHYDSVCLCFGTHQVPKRPEIKGEDTFQGEIRHSYHYKNARPFKNKYVLTIGVGETAADVVHETGDEAKDCILSIRHKQPIIARYPYARPYTNDAYSSQAIYKLHSNVINKIHCAISLAKHKLTKNPEEKALSEWNLAIPNFINHFLTKNDAFVTDLASEKLIVNESGIKEITADSVIFKDNHQYKIDTIVYNTGYKDEFDLIKDAEITDVRSLYKHMIHPELKEKIVFIGWARPAIGGVPACSEMQSRYYAKLLSKDLALPPEKELQSLIEAHKQFEETIFEGNLKLRTLVHYEQYLNDFAQILECVPSKKLLLKNPTLWFKIHYGSHLSFIYRLSGPGSSPGLAKSVIKRLPVAWSYMEIFILTAANMYSGTKRLALRQKSRTDYI